MVDTPDDVERVVERLEADAPNMPHEETERLLHESAALIQSLSSQLAEMRAERERCGNRLLVAEARAKRGYQALLDAHYHDERDLSVVIEVMAAALDTVKGAEK